MADLDKESNIREFIKFLQEKRSQGQKVVLYLGQKTGLCYTTLHTALMECAQSVHTLSPLLLPQFQDQKGTLGVIQHIQLIGNLKIADNIYRESFQILIHHFNQDGIHTVLLKALAGRLYRMEDETLANLIKAGFFSSILITPIDRLPKEVFNLVGMKESKDYQLSICEIDNCAVTEQDDSICVSIVKIFGDFFSQGYDREKTQFDLEKNAQLKQLLREESAKDIVILGYGSYLDQALELQGTGGTVWYINDEHPGVNTHLAQMLNQRNSKYLIGPQWSYDQLLQSIESLINEPVQPQYSPPQPVQRTERRKVFISYSHKDEDDLKRLRVHLDGYLYSGDVVLDIHNDIFDDTHILRGEKWKQRIDDAIAQAKVAVLLISADFLASKYIREHEIPPLLQAVEAGEVELLMVILGPCAFRRTPLVRYQAFRPPNKPLRSLTYYEQEDVWAKLADEIMDIFRP